MKGQKSNKSAVSLDSEDWDIVVYFGAMLLGDTLGNPDDVTAFLLLELQVRIKNAEMKLLHESIHVQLDLKTTTINIKFTIKGIKFSSQDYLIFKEFVFQSLLARIIARIFKQFTVFLITRYTSMSKY